MSSLACCGALDSYRPFSKTSDFLDFIYSFIFHFLLNQLPSTPSVSAGVQSRRRQVCHLLLIFRNFDLVPQDHCVKVLLLHFHHDLQLGEEILAKMKNEEDASSRLGKA